MADMMNTLKTLLGDNADAKIQNAMSMLQNSGLLNQIQSGNTAPAEVQASSAPAAATSDAESKTALEDSANMQTAVNASKNMQTAAPAFLTPEGMQFVGQIRSMVEQMSNTNDSRSNLLRSLRPFMRTDRQRSIDRAVRLINIGRFSGLFGR